MLLTLAWRNIWRNKVRSLVIICSVAVGLWAGAFIVAVYDGMAKDRIRTVIQEEVSHLQIHHPAFKEDFEPKFVAGDVDSLTAKIVAVPGVKSITARSITRGMMANASNSSGVTVIGIEPASENKTTGLQGRIIAGDFFPEGKRNPILVGNKLAEKLNIKSGNKVVLTFTNTHNNLTSGAFKVVGIYQSINSKLDGTNVYVLRQNLNALLTTPGKAHECAILLNNDDLVDSVKLQLQAIFPDLKVETWRQVSPESDLIATYTTQSAIIMVVIIMIALAFGIVNTMLMAVLERTREIGMLMALGLKKGKLLTMIIFETFLLTLVGAPFGLLVAWATVALTQDGIDISAFADKGLSEYGFSAILYPILSWDSVYQIIVIVVCAALFSAIFPAIKAIRLKPVEAIRQ
ncbi:MAG: FtsX-like permease family protein [Saprospiraceae bacterium]|nr:FtsX-like permease family protein [Saprospiraceae bacterium]MCF8248394.1 FtsX-like permease family protein [Saprospiraceae bacterium]MCF8280065.1 FtsX-like permease family protein [Bacteroidales bacterium]MCF8309922.1 FtsX-like permease family protein [Saprospiraceae bacterium]MCF8438747.1 FtsX-like permease family protein [Saprospiraceae bacterium]